MFVDDTILLTNNEDDIQTQFHRFNKFASICGDQSMILSTDNIKNDGQWLIETGMEEAPTKRFKYPGLWFTLDNSTWNQHFAKTISSAKKSFFYLYAKGLKKGHIEPSEALTLFKRLIITKLTYCAEVITPSVAAIHKVNDSFALAVKRMLGIPMSATTQPVLWEADITDFPLQLEMAKLRFHRKMVVKRTGLSMGIGSITDLVTSDLTSIQLHAILLEKPLDYTHRHRGIAPHAMRCSCPPPSFHST